MDISQPLITDSTYKKTAFFYDVSIYQSFLELMRQIDKSSLTLPKLGTYTDNYIYRMKLTQLAELSFSGNELVSIKQIPNERSYPFMNVEMRYFGFFAPYGPMPIYVTDQAKSNKNRNKDTAFEDFFAILSQRFAIYYYRASAYMNLSISSDRPDRNALLEHIEQASGLLNSQKMANNYHIQSLKRAFSGVYTKGRRTLTNLNKILNFYFDIEIKVLRRASKWIDCNPDYQKKNLGK